MNPPHKSNLDQGRQWLDDNLPPLFTIFLPKNPKFIPDADTPVTHRIHMRVANKTLAEYVEALCQNIKPIATKTNTPMQYACPPPPKTPRLVNISFAQAVKNNMRTQESDNNDQGRKKRHATRTQLAQRPRTAVTTLKPAQQPPIFKT